MLASTCMLHQCTMSAPVKSNIIVSWTTCHSFVQRKYTEDSAITPPSKWESHDINKYCFLHRNVSDDQSYASQAPGTALFQHWLSDFEQAGGSSTWDPRSEFPTWDIMNKYPDISDGGNVLIDGDINVTASDHYTLWYTTNISASEQISTAGDSVASHEPLEKQSSRKRWKRGHLTLRGVNYQPKVYYDEELLHPYSIFHDESNANVDVGGMFIRRYYNLGIWDESNQDLPLEILVLPPPVVGKPTVNNDPVIDASHLPHLSSQLKENTSTMRRLQHVELNQQRDDNDRTNEPQGQGGDHNLAQSGAVMQCALGWDWIQPTPDRNTGIWDKVEAEWIFGDVKLHDVRVQVLEVSALNEVDDGFSSDKVDTDEGGLPMGDDVSVSALLELSVTATYHNVAEYADPIKGKLRYEIKRYIEPDLAGQTADDDDDSIILASGTIQDVSIEIEHSASEFHLGRIELPNAKLWWPHTHGSQPLYLVTVTFQSHDNDEDSVPFHESQSESTFGVRTISSYTHPNTKSLAFRVNGHSVFLIGGNWVTTDQFLRYSTSQERYLHELLHLKNVGFNAVRVWGGGIAETDHFYHVADVLGLLVYQEFWMTGDNNGKMAGKYDWPLDHNSYLMNAKDVVVRLRNHPSLIMYGGGNELLPIPPETNTDQSNGPGTSPPRDIDDGLRTYISSLDGSRSYVSSSVTDIGDAFDPERSLGPKDGPYGMLNEKVFFDRNPGLTSPLLRDEEANNNLSPSDTDDKDSAGRNIGFQTEIGSVSHPELQSLKRFLSEEAIDAFPDCGVIDEHSKSVHQEWSYFKYLPFAENDSRIDHICQFQFPPVTDISSNTRMDTIEDYTWAAQLAQYFQYKALFEGYLLRMFEHNSAVFLWKSSSPAPTLRGALYDWYLETNGGYWGARAGVGIGAVKVVLNLQDWTLHVVNSSPTKITTSLLRWRAFSLDGKSVKSGGMTVPNGGVEGNFVTDIKLPMDNTPVSISWLGGNITSVAQDLNLQDVLIYRFELSYKQLNSDTSMKATNSYFLTDPNMNDWHNRQSKYALLGALRKSYPKMQVTASCTKRSLGSHIDCELKNAGDRVAIMVKLSLIKDQNDLASSNVEVRILPTYFSTNYVTLLPNESTDVQVSTIGEEILCSDGYVVPSKSPGSRLILSFDGWNVQDGIAQISCDG